MDALRRGVQLLLLRWVHDLAFDQLLSDLDERVLKAGVVEHLIAFLVWLTLELLGVGLTILGLEGFETGLLLSLLLLLFGLQLSFLFLSLFYKPFLLGTGGGCPLLLFTLNLLLQRLFAGLLLFLTSLSLSLLCGNPLLLELRPLTLLFNNGVLDCLHTGKDAVHILLLLLLALFDHGSECLLASTKLLNHSLELAECLIMALLPLLVLIGLRMLGRKLVQAAVGAAEVRHLVVVLTELVSVLADDAVERVFRHQ